MENVISSMQTHTGDVWAVIEQKGGVIPENKNIENLAAAILSIT